MAIIVQDPFTEASDTVLSSHVPNTIGLQWVDFDTPSSGSLDCEAGAGVLGSAGVATSGRAIYTSRPNPTSLDVDIQIKTTILQSGSDDPFFLVARATATNNYYSGGKYNPTAAADSKIFMQVAGVKTELATGDSGLVANDVIKFEVRNATKKLYKNGVEEISTTDNTLTANGSCGFGVGNAWAISTDDVSATWRFDDYSVNEISAATPTSLPPPPSLMPMLVR